MTSVALSLSSLILSSIWSSLLLNQPPYWIFLHLILAKRLRSDVYWSFCCYYILQLYNLCFENFFCFFCWNLTLFIHCSLLRSLIIFMTIILNYQVNHLSPFQKDLFLETCFFVWKVFHCFFVFFDSLCWFPYVRQNSYLFQIWQSGLV